MPEKVTEAGVVAYNIEAYNLAAINFIEKEATWAQTGKSKNHEAEIERCERHYCYNCLNYNYEPSIFE